MDEPMDPRATTMSNAQNPEVMPERGMNTTGISTPRRIKLRVA
jgi:hypothetical protein